MSTFNKYRTKGAYHYQWYKTEPWYKACIDECVNFCKSGTIDIGCGDGLLVSKLYEKGLGVTGVDNDPDAIQLARHHSSGGYFIQQSVYDRFVSTWRYMTCLNVIEHLDRPERLKQVMENYITKGAIIITLEWQGGAFGEDHKHEYTLEELTEFFKEFKPKPFRIKGFPEWIGVKIKV